MVQHGRVFTRSPALRNPYTIQLSMYSSSLLFLAEKSGNGADRSARLFIPHLESRGGAARSLNRKGVSKAIEEHTPERG